MAELQENEIVVVEWNSVISFAHGYFLSKQNMSSRLALSGYY